MDEKACKVEGNLTDLFQTEVIKRGEEDGKCSVDTHHPCEGKAVVSTAQKHSRLCDHFPRSHKSFPEGVSLFSAFPLLNTYQSSPARLRNRLLSSRDMPVVEGFFTEESYKKKANGCHHCEKPEAPFPFGDVEDECCEQGTKIWGENHETCPDVDFAPGKYQKCLVCPRRKNLRMLMEEKYVFDEHQPTLKTC
jgi:hypothetical protein